MHRHELSVLNALKEKKKLSLEQLLKESGLGRDEAMWALGNLAAQGFVKMEKEEGAEVRISDEGREYAKNGLPESRLLKRIGERGMRLDEIGNKQDQIGFSWAKKKGLVDVAGDMLKLNDKGKHAAYAGLEAETVLRALEKDERSYKQYRGNAAMKELEQRKLVEVRSSESVGSAEITHQGVLALAKEKQNEEMIEALDRKMIKSRSWADKKFTPYNIKAPVEPAAVAARHPLRRTIDDIRQAYLSLGFTEVSGPIIEPAFWVFDYLFVPQDHPARDVQDTFFLGRPDSLNVEYTGLVDRVKKEHETAWHGEWSRQVAMQAVARTHTTSVSGRYINKITSEINAGKKFEMPIKLFTIGRNLRNETIDPRHIADFYQHDGIVIGRGLTLANLFDILIKLYKGIGIGNLRFKPMYYPFVEPGVQLLGKHGDEWIELGGAGVIRKEITGIERSKINVLAWGPGVERILLVKKKIDSVASLYGSSVGWLREMEGA